MVGIGVVLYADYGAAQRLYAGRGYIPDGLYRDHSGVPGAKVELDDDLILWLTKKLGY